MNKRRIVTKGVAYLCLAAILFVLFARPILLHGDARICAEADAYDLRIPGTIVAALGLGLGIGLKDNVLTNVAAFVFVMSLLRCFIE